MAKQVDPLPLSDDLRRDAHGFDETSFKDVAPSAKKARRAENKKRKRARKNPEKTP